MKAMTSFFVANRAFCRSATAATPRVFMARFQSRFGKRGLTDAFLPRVYEEPLQPY